MRNLLSSLFFILIFVALGAMAFAAAPRGQEAAQPAAAPVSEQVMQEAPQDPAAPTASMWNMIALPLDTDVITDADSLATQISGVERVQRWVPGSGWESWIPAFNFGTNFPTELGGAYFVLVDNTETSPYTFTVVGDVPAQGTLQFNMQGGSPCVWNAFSIPLDQGGAITDASSLAASFSVPVDRVQRWVPGSGWESWIPAFNFGTNFDVEIGYPYFACLGGNQTWP